MTRKAYTVMVLGIPTLIGFCIWVSSIRNILNIWEDWWNVKTFIQSSYVNSTFVKLLEKHKLKDARYDIKEGTRNNYGGLVSYKASGLGNGCGTLHGEPNPLRIVLLTSSFWNHK